MESRIVSKGRNEQLCEELWSAASRLREIRNRVFEDDSTESLVEGLRSLLLGLESTLARSISIESYSSSK